MTAPLRIRKQLSESRARVAALLAQDTRSPEERTELQTLSGKVSTLLQDENAYAALEASERIEPTDATMDAETRERLEARDRSTLRGYLAAAVRGVEPSGAEAEYLAACGLASGIPIALFDGDRPRQRAQDAPTPSPTTGIGSTLAPVQPFLFAGSIAPMLGIEMPTVGSGSYSEATITTALSAGAIAKEGKQESTAAALTTVTASPRRIAGRLSMTLEDLAQIGQGNFESALRQNLSRVMSDAYDSQCVNGSGVAPNVSGLVHQLTDPSDPTDVATFALFLGSFANQIEGLWASTLKDVAIVTNPDAYKLSAQVFRANSSDDSFATYAAKYCGGWWTNKRMPATASDLARGIVHRKGMTGIRTACHPVWGMLTVDDIYTDSASGTKHVTISLLVGDKVLLVQPDAYGLVEYKVA